MQPSPNLTPRLRPEDLAAFALASGFISRALQQEPDEAWLKSLAEEDLFADWPLPAENENTRRGLELLRSYLAAWDAGRLQDLRWDYLRLFVGAGPVLAPPWESVYLSEEHLKFDDQTVEVRRWFARYGLEAPRLHSEPDDHVGLEFAFLVHLCILAFEAHQGGRMDEYEATLSAARAFLAGHPARFVPDFCQLVIQHAETGFFRGAGFLTLGTLETMLVTF